FSSRRRHTRSKRDWSSDVCSSDLSALHRLASDEVFHFYLGDPVEMLHLLPDRSHRVLTLGHDLAAGMTLQVVVPAGVWQGARLRSEERRVGKEWRARWGRCRERKE